MFQVPLAKDALSKSMESMLQAALIRHAKAGKMVRNKPGLTGLWKKTWTRNQFDWLMRVATKRTEDLTAASQVAIPAFQIAELREAAVPILNALIAEVKRNDQSAESNLKLSPLVREVDAYLKNRPVPDSQTPN